MCGCPAKYYENVVANEEALGPGPGGRWLRGAAQSARRRREAAVLWSGSARFRAVRSVRYRIQKHVQLYIVDMASCVRTVHHTQKMVCSKQPSQQRREKYSVTAVCGCTDQTCNLVNFSENLSGSERAMRKAYFSVLKRYKGQWL